MYGSSFSRYHEAKLHILKVQVNVLFLFFNMYILKQLYDI